MWALSLLDTCCCNPKGRAERADKALPAFQLAFQLTPFLIRQHWGRSPAPAAPDSAQAKDLAPLKVILQSEASASSTGWQEKLR